VDIETTGDSGGGYNIAWIAAGEWLKYSVNVGTSGTYMLTARVASPASGGRLHVEFNGTNKTGAMAVPNPLASAWPRGGAPRRERYAGRAISGSGEDRRGGRLGLEGPVVDRVVDGLG
jgi:hypothetical protein